MALLEEEGIAYEPRLVALMEGEQMSEDYFAINPNRKVPTLLDGDVTLHESNAILRYLCTKHGLDEWYPQDLRQRAAVEEWLDWNQCRLSPSVVNIVRNEVFMGDNGDAEAAAQGRAALPELAAILEAGLQRHAYLAGERATIADLSVASNISHLHLAAAAPRSPNIEAWFKRVCAIEGFRKTLPPGWTEQDGKAA
jgi:glutathione S-transferase